jgi:toxin FitB
MQARIATSLVCVSFMTVGEPVRWEEQHDWGLRRRKELASWLGSMITLPYDRNIAYTWRRISASARKRRPIADNGTWIAANCIAHDVPLATANVRPFAEHHGLVLATDSTSDGPATGRITDPDRPGLRCARRPAGPRDRGRPKAARSVAADPPVRRRAAEGGALIQECAIRQRPASCP